MATHYRTTIADILQSYDNNKKSRDFYMDLAWEGLDKLTITAWGDLGHIEQQRIKDVFKNYINQNKNQSCN